jgi:TonB-dependent SusC/RagA subfamily outer membrane receptor
MTRYPMIPRTLFGGALMVFVEACALSVPVVDGPPPCDVLEPADVRCADVGYGLRPRRTQTGSIGSYIVDGKDLGGVGRIEQLIEGRIPGVTVEPLPNGEFSIRVRGSLSGSNNGEPLIVIDGIPAPLGLTSRMILGAINPAAVARIDVLRDAGSAAAYGSRGAHGVILVTTRR